MKKRVAHYFAWQNAAISDILSTLMKVAAKRTVGKLHFATRRSFLLGFLAAVSVTCGTFAAQAGAAISFSDPTTFFTNVAARIVQAQLGLDLTHLQIYPTNQYTPALHRLLQVTANVYDAATNRTYGFSDLTNGFPTVFRPLFRRADDGAVYIVAYREVTNIDMAVSSNAPAMADLDMGWSTNTILSLGTPLDPVDKNEPMVAGIPLVIGARKGFPNFNEFGMQTAVQVTRKLQFLKEAASGPVVLTNQMYFMSISNAFGVEAWNSYTSSYPHDLQMIVAGDMTCAITNELGKYVYSNSILFSNTVLFGSTTTIPAGTWTRFIPINPTYARFSLIAPFNPATNWFYFLPPASYSETQGAFIFPYQTNFEQGLGFPVPRWYLLLRPRLRYILVDVAANRIVDYVNLVANKNPIDLTTALTTGATMGPNDQYVPDGFYGSMFLTNRSTNVNVNITEIGIPTYGIRNQIAASMGSNFNNMVWQPAFPPALDRISAIQLFLTNFFNGGTNLSFLAPYAPMRNLYVFTSWQANDPLVHYTVPDLISGVPTNSYELDLPLMSTMSISNINFCYEPWGFNMYHQYGSITLYENAVKDPLITASDQWSFPVNPFGDLKWLGQVHRGTPWQTLYLKSTPFSLPNWEYWTGNLDPSDAARTLPTNDWSMVCLLMSLLTKNDPHTLLSVNETAVPTWTATMDGIDVLTNLGGAQFADVLMSSNSPQAAIIANGINAARVLQPDGHFHQVSDILAAPELSVASPWLNATTNEQQSGISDAAYEAIPSQLLTRLRTDSAGSVVRAGGSLQVQFTGFDGYSYAVRVSTDLHTWISVSTNTPLNGSFMYTEPSPAGGPSRFYRSVLLP